MNSEPHLYLSGNTQTPTPTMLYSGRHCEAVRTVYQRMFGESIPVEVLQAANENGTLYRLIEAIDQATNSGEPIRDWRRLAGPKS